MNRSTRDLCAGGGLRTDDWGGDADRRRRFALAVLREIRREVGADFPIGIKLNSADFQRGGFSEDESMEAIQALAEGGVDLIEISGGTYEAPAMTGTKKIKESTRQREAYFLEFASARAARSAHRLWSPADSAAPPGWRRRFPRVR